MIDHSVAATALGDGRIRYDLGKPNWEPRRVPDIHQPAATTAVAPDRMIDIVILGDGFTTRAQFLSSLTEWLTDFYAVQVYATFAGCLRIRALYTPSRVPASADRDSTYRVKVSDDGKEIVLDEGAWWAADDADGVAFRTALWDGVDTFEDVNLRRYPLDIDVGDDTQAITNKLLRDLYRNLVVCLLVRTTQTVFTTPPPEFNTHPSGAARDVARPDPYATRHVRVAMGANEIHELGHAFGLLSDEYINGRSKPNERINPTTPSVFSLSNLVCATRLDEFPVPSVDQVPWLHLSPGGWQGRTASGSDPSPVVGWLWVGGGVHLGVWHSEYRCLMNGTHDNFAFTQVASADPTANTDGTYTEEGGEKLRDRDRLCLWCQEIVAIRILEKSDQLLEDGDPDDITTQGLVWYARWVDRLRSSYYELFAVARQLADNEARYATLTPGRNGEPLWQSDLYSVPAAAPQGPRTTVAPLADDELFILAHVAATA
jgi:hypothetical protein